jgi:hypothetical protein
MTAKNTVLIIPEPLCPVSSGIETAIFVGVFVFFLELGTTLHGQNAFLGLYFMKNRMAYERDDP